MTVLSDHPLHLSYDFRLDINLLFKKSSVPKPSELPSKDANMLEYAEYATGDSFRRITKYCLCNHRCQLPEARLVHFIIIVLYPTDISKNG